MNRKNHLTIGLFLGFFTITSWAKTLPSKPPGYAVASAHPIATNVGLQILAQGGNAFDAAVAVAATLAVVEPYHSGFGGGSFWLLYDAKANKHVFIDARETAPQKAHKDLFLDKNKDVIPGLSLNGGLAAAIPGQPAALVYLAEHYGRLPLKQTLAPAIQIARDGFAVDAQYRYFSEMEGRKEQLNRYPVAAAIFLKDKHSYAIGDTLVQKDLAHTLTAIAEQGHKGFYSGAIAQQLVDGVNKTGGIWTLDDLAKYQVTERSPLIGAFHNMLIITAPPPSAGGIALLTMLNILSHVELATLSQVQRVHYLVEAMRLAYWQRDEYLGDPDFVKIPLETLNSAENGSHLFTLIPINKALPSVDLQSKAVNAIHSNSTTHISILDAEGNRVAATMTINYIFGSSVVPEGTGVLLNNEMDDFSVKTGVSNVFGLVGSDKNAIAAGKRPLSSMTPTFLELPGHVAIVGTPGGSKIPSMMLLAALEFYNSYGAISMVSAMRFHHQYLPDRIQFEPETFSAGLQQGLKAMGYTLLALKEYYGDMQAITWDKENQVVTAASDPRHIGLAVVIPQPTP